MFHKVKAYSKISIFLLLGASSLSSMAEIQKHIRKGALASSIQEGLKFQLNIDKITFDEASQNFSFYAKVGNNPQGAICHVLRKKNADGSRLKKAIYANVNKLELKVQEIDIVSNSYENMQSSVIKIKDSNVIESIKCDHLTSITDFLEAFTVDAESQMALFPLDEVIVEDLSGPNVEEASKAYSSHI